MFSRPSRGLSRRTLLHLFLLAGIHAIAMSRESMDVTWGSRRPRSERARPQLPRADNPERVSTPLRLLGVRGSSLQAGHSLPAAAACGAAAHCRCAASDASVQGGGAPAAEEAQLSTQEERRQRRQARQAATAARTAARQAEEEARDQLSQEQHQQRSARIRERVQRSAAKQQQQRARRTAERQRLAALMHGAAGRWPPALDMLKQLPDVNFSTPDEPLTACHYLGPMDSACSHCGALHFVQGRLKGSTRRSPRFGKCCMHGQVSLPALQEPPQPLRDLLTHDVARAKEFRQKIRAYNCSLQLASSSLKDSPPDDGGAQQQQRGVRSVRMHGRMFHLIGPLLPAPGAERAFAQLWIYDSSYNSVALRLGCVVLGLALLALQRRQPSLLHAAEVPPPPRAGRGCAQPGV
jgi:hypothetical protein